MFDSKDFSIVIITSLRFFKIGVVIDTWLTLQKERLLQGGRDKELALRSIHKKRHKPCVHFFCQGSNFCLLVI